MSASEIVTWMKDDIAKKIHMMDDDEKKELSNIGDEEFLLSANEMIAEGDKNSDNHLSEEEFWTIMTTGDEGDMDPDIELGDEN